MRTVSMAVMHRVVQRPADGIRFFPVALALGWRPLP